jgi:hypothetical protein
MDPLAKNAGVVLGVAGAQKRRRAAGGVHDAVRLATAKR